MKKILLATDGSEYSEHAAEMTGKFLDAWPAATVVVLYVTAREHYAYDLAPDAVDRYEEKISQKIEEDIIERLSRWETRVRFIHRTGHPSTTICEVAAAEHVDMIILGSHGRGAVNRVLLGSVADGVLHCSHISVLIAKH